MPRTMHPTGWETHVAYDEDELRECLVEEPDFEFSTRDLTRRDDGEAPVSWLLTLAGLRGKEKLFRSSPHGSFSEERWPNRASRPASRRGTTASASRPRRGFAPCRRRSATSGGSTIARDSSSTRESKSGGA